MERRNIFVVLVCLYGVQMTFANKPSELPQGIFCEGCIATVQEILKKVDKKTGESREVKTIDAMEDICNLQNFGKYEYSPPKTGQACRYLIDNYDEEIEKIILSEMKDFEQKICYELTKACEGVDRTKKVKEEMDVRINDEKQKVQPATPPEEKKKGPETMHVNINDKDAANKLIQQISESIKNKKQNNDDDGEDDEDNDMSEENTTDKPDNEKTEL